MHAAAAWRTEERGPFSIWLHRLTTRTPTDGTLTPW
jgi:hypothetical protein